MVEEKRVKKHILNIKVWKKFTRKREKLQKRYNNSYFVAKN